MKHQRRFFQLLAALVVGVSLFALSSGCSMGYIGLRPGENSAFYAHLFDDLISAYDEPYWLWIRGSVGADMNGDGKVEEEIVVATVQKGTDRNPGPIEMALLVVCEVGADDTRTALARTVLFDKNPIPAAPRPVNDIGIAVDAPLTRARLQVVQDKATLKETVVAYFWGDSMPGGVWYAGYALDGGKLVKNLEAVFWQSAPGFITANLDRSIDASPFGYQLLFSVHALPDEIARKLGPASEAPLWGHVYARDRGGVYRQADWRFGSHYRQLENRWNQTYLNAAMKQLPNEELAWFEYHMGLMNHYTGNEEMSSIFLAKAEKYAANESLVKAIEAAKENLSRTRPRRSGAAGQDIQTGANKEGVVTIDN